MGDGRGRILCFILGNLHVRTRVTPADLAVLVARVHELDLRAGDQCRSAARSRRLSEPVQPVPQIGRRRAAPLTSGVSSAEGEVPAALSSSVIRCDCSSASRGNGERSLRVNS